MRILFVCENYAPHIGGAEIVFKTLAEELVKRGHTVDLVTHHIPGTRRIEVINGVRVHRVRCFDSRYAFTFFSVPTVLKLARHADIVHTTTFNGAPPAWAASRLLGKKCIITAHEVWVGKWKDVTDKTTVSAALHDLLEKLIYALPFDHYACVSHHTRAQLTTLGIAERKSSVVYNGVDYRHFAPQHAKKPDLFTFLCYGRPGPSKGIEIAVHAFKKVTMPAQLLLMLSKDSAYRKRYQMLRTLVKSLGLQHVRFIDPVPWAALPQMISSVHCVVIPSFAEGFCFAAAETAAVGTPLLATTTGSIPEVVSGNYILVPPRNIPALAQGMMDMAQKKYNKAPLKTFPVHSNVEKYLAIYSGVQ